MSTSKTDSKNLVENAFIKVNEQGILYLKSTSYTGRRKIAELDTGKDIEEQLKPYQERFKALVAKKEELLNTMSRSGEENDFKDKIGGLIDEFKTAGIVGDIETELNELAEIHEDISNTKEPADDDKISETPLSYYQELAEKAEDLAKQTDWPYVDMELNILQDKWVEGPEMGEECSEQLQKLSDRLKKAREHFEERKQAHYE